MLALVRRVILGGLATILLAAPPAWGQTGVITGRLTDAATGQPLAGGRINAMSESGRIAASTFSDNAGRYVLTNLPGGMYSVAIALVGYAATRLPPVTVGDDETVTVDAVLSVAPIQLNPIQITMGIRPERLLDAPASVTVLERRDIVERPTVTPADHLRGVPGTDIITTGLQSTNVALRGFNNIFSGSVFMLSDHRLAGVPSLRVNLMHFTPQTNEDLARMEVVLGPGAALFGPNTADGVIHMLSRSPFDGEETALSVMGGERNLFQGGFRTAHLFSDRLGIKLSGQYLTADDWVYVDPTEQAERGKFDADPFFRHDLIAVLRRSTWGADRSDTELAVEADRRIALIGARDNRIQRWSGEARLDWRATDALTAIVQAGANNSTTGVELTGLGAGQVHDWRYSYVQARTNWNRFFAQVYLNASNAGETYLLRTGQPIVDESTLFVTQVQHRTDLQGGRQTFTYGLDYFFTNPQTRGTINGIYEDEDETREFGGYLQSQTQLGPRFDLVLAGRLDTHSALPDPLFSPRAALVFKPMQDHSFRVTATRAFSTPTSLNQFLDLPTAMPDQATNPDFAAAARLGYSVRVQGTGTTGFRFQQSDGSFLMRVPALLGGPDQAIPANVAPFWPAAVAVLAQQGALPPELAQYLAGLQPTAAQIGTNAIIGTQSIPLQDVPLPDIAPIRESTATTFETGYKGILGQRLLLTADVWYTIQQDFVTPLTVSTPLLAMNGLNIVQFLVPRFMQDLGHDQATATELAINVAGGLARVPLGVITSPDISGSGAQLLATYSNVDDELRYGGVDLSASALLTDRWSLQGTASFVNKDHFMTAIGPVTLNAPTRKGSLAAQYRSTPAMGINGELRVRYNNEFPVQSGVYQGTACIEGGLAQHEDCVKSYTLVDANLGYTLPPAFGGATIHLIVQNLFDEGFRSYPGAPVIGRMAMLRLRYVF